MNRSAWRTLQNRTGPATPSGNAQGVEDPAIDEGRGANKGRRRRVWFNPEQRSKSAPAPITSLKLNGARYPKNGNEVAWIISQLSAVVSNAGGNPCTIRDIPDPARSPKSIIIRNVCCMTRFRQSLRPPWKACSAGTLNPPRFLSWARRHEAEQWGCPPSSAPLQKRSTQVVHTSEQDRGPTLFQCRNASAFCREPPFFAFVSALGLIHVTSVLCALRVVRLLRRRGTPAAMVSLWGWRRALSRKRGWAPVGCSPDG